MDDLQEIMEDFLVEAFELIEQMDQDLVELESNPDDLELLNGIFRVAHTVKGSSSFLNFDILTELTHHMEDVLNKARKDELKITSDIMDVILESVDMMKGLLESIKENSTDADSGIEIKDICAKFDAISNGEVIPVNNNSEDIEAEINEVLTELNTAAPVQENNDPAPETPKIEETQNKEEEELDLANLSDEEVEKEIERLLAQKMEEKLAKKSKKG
jgi:two-component system chemotaxis sensor kinase CheA